LPEEEYDWFATYGMDGSKQRRIDRPRAGMPLDVAAPGESETATPSEASADSQREFFEFAGPLFSVRVSPATCTMPVNSARQFRAIARDRGGRLVAQNMIHEWSVVEGVAQLLGTGSEFLTLTAPGEPQLVRLQVRARQAEIVAAGEALITVTDSIIPERPRPESQGGLPDYTFDKRPGELWRSRFDLQQNVIVINNGHRDFVYATRNRSLKLRYICRLFAKELVIRNFPGYSADELAERMIELLLYTEENLR
jgi:hypothetical protein